MQGSINKHSLIRKLAAKFETAASVSLNQKSAAGLARVCKEFEEDLRELGTNTFSLVATTCRFLCEATEKKQDDEFSEKADVLIKTCFTSLQTAFFNVVVGNKKPEDCQEKSKELVVQVLEFLKNETSFVLAGMDGVYDKKIKGSSIMLGEAKGVNAVKDQYWQALEKLTESSLKQKTWQKSASEHYLKSVGKLSKQIQVEGSLRSMALDESEKIDETETSISFSEFCREQEKKLGLNFKTDTPEAELEEGYFQPVISQLLSWMKENREDLKGCVIDASDLQNGPVICLSLRNIGGVLWLECRQDFSDEYINKPEFSETEIPDSTDFVAGVGVEERYLARDRTFVRRVRMLQNMPFYHAYELSCSGRKFLISAGDVQFVFQRVSDNVATVPIEKLLGLPGRWVADTHFKQGVLVRFNELSGVLEVEKVTGPNRYFTKNVEFAGPNRKGLIGITHVNSKERAPILDLYPLFEKYQKDNADAFAYESENDKTERYVIFRVRGRRYAVELRHVRAVGRLAAYTSVGGYVQTPQGDFRLCDIKALLGVEGERGSVFVAISRPGPKKDTTAWVVDGLEPLQEFSVRPEQIRQSIFGVARGDNLVIGSISPDKTAGSTIYFINPEFLKPVIASRVSYRNNAA